MFDNAHLIHSYSRRQAIEDGVLIDVSKFARELGIRHPTALTAGVWERCVAVPPGVTGQDETGRLWDVVFLLRLAIAGCRGSEVGYSLHVRDDNREGAPPLVWLRAVCGPGDQAEPVITVMLPDEH